MAGVPAPLGHDALAVRASKKLRNDELRLTSLAGTILRMSLDRVPLWRNNHVAVKQLAEDFGAMSTSLVSRTPPCWSAPSVTASGC